MMNGTNCFQIPTSEMPPRWSQRRLPLEFMDGLDYTTIIEFAEPLARRRGSEFEMVTVIVGG